jgi:hypothetical protein
MPDRRPSRPALALAAACALAAWAAPARAAPNAAAANAAAPTGEARLDESRAVVIIAAEGTGTLAARFAEALAEALEREAASAGIAASRAPADAATGPDSSEPAAARAASAASGARWAMMASARVEGTRILWRASIYDGESGSLVGADAFSAYAGLSALALIDASAASAVGAARGAMSRQAAAGEAALRPIDRRLRFASPDEGAVLSIGDHPLGAIELGELEARYFAFAPGSGIAVRIQKNGYWPRTQVVKVSGEEPIGLKPLFRETRSAFGASWGTGRLLGVAGSYRRYLLSDRVYLRAEDSLWAAYDFSKAARPALHDELRLGIGAYLLFDPLARFRVSAGIGGSLIGTFLTSAGAEPRLGLDACIEPVFFTLEWHEPTWAIAFEARYPYSLGLAPGFLRKGWLSLGEAGPQFYSIGILFKR